MAVNMTAQSIAVGDNWTKVGNDYVGSSPNGATSGGTAALAWSAPSGLSQGSSISLATDGTNPFGTGPTNVKYEDFESLTAGTRMETTANTIFDTVSPFWSAPIENDIARSGNNSAKFTAPKESDSSIGASINFIDFTGGTDEVFISYAVQVPSGAYMVGANGGNSGTNADYSNDSAWKTAWLLGPSRNDGLCDLVLATLVGDTWTMQGNDLGTILTLGPDAPSWWKFANWNRMSAFLKAGATPQTDAGNAYFQIANGQEAITEYSGTPVIFANANSASEDFIDYKWYAMSINGWMRDGVGGSDGAGAGIDTRYDDIYVSWGANAAARVELGDNAVYTSCTNLHIQYVTPANWATGQLDFDIDYGPFSPSDSLWLHITLENNSTRYAVAL